MKRLRKNPLIYDYGYHFTFKENLNYIIDNGFRIREDSNPYIPDKIIYGNIKPIYFVTSPNYFNNYYKTVLTSYLSQREYFLKVNVKNFNQNVDISALVDWGDYESGPIFSTENKNLVIHSDIIYHTNKGPRYPSILQRYPLINEWFIKFDYRIPLSEFKTNQQLILDTIITTQSFTILENISPNHIIDVVRIKK